MQHPSSVRQNTGRALRAAQDVTISVAPRESRPAAAANARHRPSKISIGSTLRSVNPLLAVVEVVIARENPLYANRIGGRQPLFPQVPPSPTAAVKCGRQTLLARQFVAVVDFHATPNLMLHQSDITQCWLRHQCTTFDP